MTKLVVVGLLWTMTIGVVIRMFHLIIEGIPITMQMDFFGESMQIAALIGITTITVFSRVLPKFEFSQRRRYLIGYAVVMLVYFIVLPMYDGIMALLMSDTYYAALIIMILVFPLIKFIERNART